METGGTFTVGQDGLRRTSHSQNRAASLGRPGPKDTSEAGLGRRSDRIPPSRGAVMG